MSYITETAMCIFVWFYNNGVFPTKIIWKRMVNYKVKKKYCDQWAGRISADQSLQRVGLLSGPHRKLYDSNRSTVSFLIHKFNKAFCKQLPFRRLLCSLVIRGVYESFNVLLKCMNITHDYKKSFSKTYPQIRVHITMHFQMFLLMDDLC